MGMYDLEIAIAFIKAGNASGIPSNILNSISRDVEERERREREEMTLPENFTLIVSSENLETLLSWSIKKEISGSHSRNVDDTSDKWGIKPEKAYEIEAKTFCFNEITSKEIIVKTMKSEGFVPAKLRHLISVKNQFPNLKVPIEIVALGSTITFGIMASSTWGFAIDTNGSIELSGQGISYYLNKEGKKAIFLGVKANSEPKRKRGRPRKVAK